MVAGWTLQISDSRRLVLNVSNQIVRPMIMVNRPQTTLKYPANFNQPLVMGITIAGRVRRKVTKIRTAFPMAAGLVVRTHSGLEEEGECLPLRGHVLNSRFTATLSSVAVSWSCTCCVKAKTRRSAPDATNRRSAPMYVRRILSFAILYLLDRVFPLVS